MAIDRIDADGVAVDNLEIGGTEAAKMPVGTTAQRANAQVGDLRHNTDTGVLEQYTADLGWVSIAAFPVVSSISPAIIDGADTSFDITITGNSFTSGATVTAIGTDGSTINASTVTRNSTTELVATFNGTLFDNAQEDYDIRVTNNTGLAGTLNDILAVNTSPTFTTSTNATVATIWDSGDSYSPIATLGVTDAEGESVTISETGTVLSDIGVTVNSNGTLTGDPTDLGGTSEVTKNFTAAATDGTYTTSRTFNLVIRPMRARGWYKSENIDDSGSVFAWTNSGTGSGTAYTLNQWGSKSDFTYTASDSSYNNQATLYRSNTTASSGLISSTIGTSRAQSSPLTMIWVGQQDVDRYSGLGESMVGWGVSSQNDGDWMWDTGGDHSWGGQYGEWNASGSPVLNAKRFMALRWGGSGNAQFYRTDGSHSTITDVAARQFDKSVNEIGVAHTHYLIMGNYPSGAGTSHSFTGKLAEVMYFDYNLGDDELNYWYDYLLDKFGAA